MIVMAHTTARTITTTHAIIGLTVHIDTTISMDAITDKQSGMSWLSHAILFLFHNKKLRSCSFCSFIQNNKNESE